MDSEDLSPETFASVIADLAQVNSVTFARGPTISFVKRALNHVAFDTPVTILDVGFGDGDMLRAIADLLTTRAGIRLIGYDINPRSAPAARSRTPSDMPIEYVTGNATSLDPSLKVDLIISSLVAHHMTDEEITAFLTWMEGRATRGWLVNDLHRHPVAYYGFRLLAALARWHPIVRHDGAISVKRSFSRSDWLNLTAAAKLPSGAAKLRWHFPFRWCVERLR